MKKIFLLCLMTIGATSYAQVQKPVYLDESKNIEERVEDALKHMTLS